MLVPFLKSSIDIEEAMNLSRRKSHLSSVTRRLRKSQRRKNRERKRTAFTGMRQIPLHHRLVPMIFTDSDPVMNLYGTSHIREILERDHSLQEQKELDVLEEDVYQERRAYFETVFGLLYNEKNEVIDMDMNRVHALYSEPTPYNLMFYLSYKHSPETIHELLPFYHKVISDKKEEDVVGFLKKALSLRDYLINSPYLYNAFLANLPTTNDKRRVWKLIEETEKKLDDWTSAVIRRIHKMYITPTGQKNRYENEDTYYSTLPKGTTLYRGFKRNRGPLNVERGFSFFVWDAITCMRYILPTEEAYRSFYYTQEDTTQLKSYCHFLGGIAEVQTTKPLRLLNMAKASTLRYLLSEMKAKHAPEIVIQYLKEGWILNNDNMASNTYRRNSYYHKDMVVVKWLQEHGYHGYVAMDVEGLHDEIVIFNITENVHVKNIYTSEDLNMPLCGEPYLSLDIGLDAA